MTAALARFTEAEQAALALAEEATKIIRSGRAAHVRARLWRP
jgi:hypothetical protein